MYASPLSAYIFINASIFFTDLELKLGVDDVLKKLVSGLLKVKVKVCGSIVNYNLIDKWRNGKNQCLLGMCTDNIFGVRVRPYPRPSVSASVRVRVRQCTLKK